MLVTSDFKGGNADIKEINGDTVTLDAELRDTVGDWFFWCFKVEGAEGRTLTFNFKNKNRVGYFGAAVSCDLENWHWQYDEPHYNGNSFTYTFGENETEVYFAHDMVYRPKRFFDFAHKKGIALKTLCMSEKGRAVPYIDTETGEECILLTARHHACESTGSYVLEGVLDSVFDAFGDRFRIICVPFVDLDGVVDGDQGKNRNGCDHNRDYEKDKAPIYNSTREIRRLADTLNIRFAFDFHSPWHLGEENDTLFIPIKHYGIIENITRFSHLLEAENGEGSLLHFTKNNIMPDVKWNKFGSPCFGTYLGNCGAELAFTLETPYFYASERMFTPERAFETGRKFVRALEKYSGKI